MSGISSRVDLAKRISLLVEFERERAANAGRRDGHVAALTRPIRSSDPVARVVHSSRAMITEHLNVSGMTCDGCVANVTRALSSVSGVHVVDVSLPKHIATVQVDDVTSSDAMRAAVRSAGYDIVDSPVMSKSGGCCES